MSQTFIPEYEDEMLECIHKHARFGIFPAGVKLVREQNGRYFVSLREDGVILNVIRTAIKPRSAWQWFRGGACSDEVFRTRKEAALAGLLALSERAAT